jgi:hypothetical protein
MPLRRAHGIRDRQFEKFISHTPLVVLIRWRRFWPAE